MKKLFIIAILIFAGFTANSFAQDGAIEKMISAQQKIGGMMAGLLGANSLGTNNAEYTNLSAVTFPTSVKIKYLAETRELSKSRKKAVDRWLKEFNKTPNDKKFYASETLIAENGTNYWVIAKQNVLDKLKTKQMNDSIILRIKILGSYQKGSTTDYFLLTDGLERSFFPSRS